MKCNQNMLAILAACGAVAGLGSAVIAQPTVVHMSGATLLENYVKARAATVDFIDADGDKIARGIPNSPGVDQLAPFSVPSSSGASATFSPGTHWMFIYSSVGSTRGLQELIDNGRTWNTGNSTSSTMGLVNRSKGYFNRYQYINGGAGFDDNTNPEDPVGVNNFVNTANPAGLPFRAVRNDIGSNPVGQHFRAVYTFGNTPSTAPTDGLTVDAGATVDIAILDVPVTYAVTQTATLASAAKYNRFPLEVGYGDNGRTARKADGTAATGTIGNKLATLTGGANLNSASPDANTIFDTTLFFAPVAPIANFGTGLDRIDQSDLQHLFTTGRMKSGENLIAVTRDSGSGTRNSWQNSIGVDPSWGVGENVGARNNTTGNASNDVLGPNFLPSNKGGNPRVEASVFNHRLAIGYVGPERGLVNGAPDLTWLPGGNCDILSVKNDTAPYNGTLYTRPTLSSILDNNLNGNAWVIGGPASLASFGNPKAAPIEAAGSGWLELYQDVNNNNTYDLGEPFNDINGNTVRDAVEARPAQFDLVTYPKMRNVEAAKLINNITRSIDAFVSLPGGDTTVFTPGELAAIQYILLGAQPFEQTPTNPTLLRVNPAFNPSLQSFIRNESGNIQGNAQFASFGTGVAPANMSNSRAGKVPARFVPANAAENTYSDKGLVPNGDAYITEGGTLLTYNTTVLAQPNLPLRNLVAGDFNGDGLRNTGDAADLVRAWRKRHASGTWTAPNASGALLALANTIGTAANGTDLSIEIIGDFNGDGSFTTADVRYWADGLAVVTGSLNRFEGFKAIDQQSFAAGGSANFFGTILGNGVTSMTTYNAGDTAADVAGSGREARGFAPVGSDGRVNGADIDFIFSQLRVKDSAGSLVVDGGEINWATELDEAAFTDLSADVTGDLKINQADAAYVVNTVLCTNFGDINLDGQVNAADVSIIGTPTGAAGTWATGDVDGNGLVEVADLTIVNANVGKPRPCCPTDFNFDGTTSADDIFAFLDQWFAQNGSTGSADYNNSGGVTADDIFAFLDAWFAGNGTSCQ